MLVFASNFWISVYVQRLIALFTFTMMTDFLPLFPLKLVVFPGELLNLHIFEPRYKQLVRECEDNHITFGIPAYIDDKLMDFGTELKLLGIEQKNEDGSMDIRTEGVGIFKIHNFYQEAPQKLYPGADIERMVDNSSGDPKKYELIVKAVEELFQLLNIEKDIPTLGNPYLTYELAHHMGFSLAQEYSFLCIPTERKRQHFMLTHLEQLIPVVIETERLRKKANMNGHFKNVISPGDVEE